MMRRGSLLFAVAFAIIALAIWRPWPDLELPAFGSDDAPAPRSEDDADDDDPILAEALAERPPARSSVSAPRAAPAAYDPWNPPPPDPNAPRLPDPEPADERFAITESLVSSARDALAHCRETFPTHPTVRIWVDVTRDGANVRSPELVDEDDQPIETELDTCLRSQLAEMDTGFYDRDHPFTVGLWFGEPRGARGGRKHRWQVGVTPPR